ncbi:hypothetical protein [Streptomyces sp. NPDC001108]
MSEEYPVFTYLRCRACTSWLAVYGLPSTAHARLAARAPGQGWVREKAGTWLCDEHPADRPPTAR